MLRRHIEESRLVLSTFADLGVLPEIVEALDAVDIKEAFPIQEMTLPIALMGTDLIGQARTGTGKTLAFSVPVLQRVVAPRDPDYDELVAPGKPQALIIAPTRELALQVTGDLSLAGKNRGARTLTVYGGVPYQPQLDGLKQGVDIVVGTPGRLLDLSTRKDLDLSHVKVLVLDEADEMLDLGFLPDVERLLAMTPELRQTMLFSATMRGEVVALARTHMRHPVNVRAESSGENQTVPATAQFVYQTHDLDKPEVIARIMQAENRGLSMVFTRTKRHAQQLADELIDRGFPAAALHGDLPQAVRERTLDRFRSGRTEILVATDVAGRGIDVEGVTHVINYACPDDEKTYVHRIGRTGRAGASGVAITFVDWADVARWKMINKALDLPYDEPLETYSTSEHLLHEQGIPAEATGCLRPARPAQVERGGGRDRGPRDGAPRDRAAQDGAPGDGRAKPTSRRRNRVRKRSGQVVAGDGSAGSRRDDASNEGSTPGGSSASASGADGGARGRRPRKRSRSGNPASTPPE